MGRAIEDFRDSKEYREELLASGFLSYQVGYEDAREAVRSSYPELNLDSIVPPELEAPATEEMTDPSSGGLTTRAEAKENAERATEDQAAPIPEARAGSPTVPSRHPVEEAHSEDYSVSPLLLLVILVVGLRPSFVNLT